MPPCAANQHFYGRGGTRRYHKNGLRTSVKRLVGSSNLPPGATRAGG
jgi:hypothetical protein